MLNSDDHSGIILSLGKNNTLTFDSGYYSAMDVNNIRPFLKDNHIYILHGFDFNT